MQNSPQSSLSDDLDAAFNRLHPGVQRWIYDQQWAELREVQARAINAIYSSNSDIVLAAATASGKTEAAFLPLLSLIVEASAPSFQVMYVGPLRALINDQFFRLELLCEQLQVPVVKWHGDVQDSMKRQGRERPAGVLLITPESLEALFVRKPELISRMFGSLRFIVIDELHTFLSTERGIQLASLLKRLDDKLKVSPRRVGLSATIGDLELAAHWLRPADPASVIVINDISNTADLRLQVRGISMPATPPKSARAAPGEGKPPLQTKDVALRQIAAHLFEIMRTKGNHLIFASSRREVELLADMLREMSESIGVPNEFFPHHGNLSREVRETVEHRLKEGSEPTTAVATSTLELGVDIGAVESVAQIGAPRSIAALRQRMGRSGRRRGKPSILRIYARETAITEKSSLMERLRLDTIQSVAAVRLLLDKWVEPPLGLTQNFSTLLHQILALIVEHGGITYARLLEILGGPGPFNQIPKSAIRDLLKGMAATDPALLEQAPDDTLMLGKLGERITESYEFFAVFKTPEEFRIVANGRTLGTVSIINSFGPDDFVVFAGQRWKVIEVNNQTRTVMVEGAPAGRAPMFEGGEPSPLHDRFVAEVKAVLLDADVPSYLDDIAARHLAEGRESFRTAALDESSVTMDKGSIFLFPWRGTFALDALRLALKREGVVGDDSVVAIRINAEHRDKLANALAKLSEETEIDGPKLAELDHNLERSKYDSLIPAKLLQQAAAKDRLDTKSIPYLAKTLRADLIAL